MNRKCIKCDHLVYYSNSRGKIKYFNKCYEHLMESRQVNAVMKFVHPNQSTLKKSIKKITGIGYVIFYPDLFIYFLVENNLYKKFYFNTFKEQVNFYKDLQSLDSGIQLHAKENLVIVDATECILSKTNITTTIVSYV